MPLAANPLIQVTPGLMIWTIVCFLITLFVLKRYAFGPIQKALDERRDRIRRSLEEADQARAEAHELLEQHRQLIGQAKSDAEDILAEARRVADAQRERVRQESEEDRARLPGGVAAPDTNTAQLAVDEEVPARPSTSSTPSASGSIRSA